MAESMTGFGRGSASGPAGTVTAEIKTVNSRFLELNFRTDSLSPAAEEVARYCVKQGIFRGKASLFLSFTPDEGCRQAEVSVDEPLLDAYIEALQKASLHKGMKKQKLTAAKLLGLPMPWLRVASVKVPDEVLVSLVQEAVTQALSQLKAMRLREGASLVRDLEQRLQLLRDKLQFLQSMQDEVVRQYEQRLRDRIETLLAGKALSLDEGRLLEEVAVYAEKTDYTEEVVRFGSHLDQFEAALSGEGPIGRKLDFLLQELNREVNTIASKANDLSVVDCVIIIKTELEKIREQVQNME